MKTNSKERGRFPAPPLVAGCDAHIANHQMDDTPFQAGLGFTVAMNKPGGFISQQALVAMREQHQTRRFAQFKPTDANAPLLYHEESIWRAGKIVGSIRSGSFGHRIGTSLGMGYLTNADRVDAVWLAA